MAPFPKNNDLQVSDITLLAQELVRLGTKCVFGIPGEGPSLLLLDALEKYGCAFYLVSHEAAGDSWIRIERAFNPQISKQSSHEVLIYELSLVFAFHLEETHYSRGFYCCVRGDDTSSKTKVRHQRGLTMAVSIDSPEG